jgi:DNA-binding response OmpR family regulator
VVSRLAADFQEASSKIETEFPDLVVMEVPRRGSSVGWNLARSLCSKAKVPVVVNSLFDPRCEPTAPLPVRAWVVKSGDTSELKEKIREALGRRLRSGAIAPRIGPALSLPEAHPVC